MEDQKLRTLSTNELAVLGIASLGYVKFLQVGPDLKYVACFADGTPIGLHDSLSSAIIELRKNDLTLVSLH